MKVIVDKDKINMEINREQHTTITLALKDALKDYETWCPNPDNIEKFKEIVDKLENPEYRI